MKTSKQAMAKQLVALGHAKSWNTLRQWTVERLQAELDAMQAVPAMPIPARLQEMAQCGDDHTPVEETWASPVAQLQREKLEAMPSTALATIPHLPLVPENYGVIVIPGPRDIVEQPKRTWYHWLGLAAQPFVLLARICGL